MDLVESTVSLSDSNVNIDKLTRNNLIWLRTQVHCTFAKSIIVSLLKLQQINAQLHETQLWNESWSTWIFGNEMKSIFVLKNVKEWKQ